VCESGCCTLPHASWSEQRVSDVSISWWCTCQSPELLMLRVWWVGLFCVMTLMTDSTAVSLCIRCSFTCWFTVHCVEATPLSPPRFMRTRCQVRSAGECGRVTCNGGIWTCAACGRMVGADCTVFLCGSCSEFQAEFAVSRADSACNDCHVRPNDSHS